MRRFRHASPLLAILLSGALACAAQAVTPEVLDFDTISHEERISRDCAITFDDGPGPHTALLLDLLATKQIKATFFVLGEHVRRYPELILRMVAEGQEVENHSWDHPDMRKLDETARRQEIESTVALLKTLGVTPHFFRPPYGSFRKNQSRYAQKFGLRVVLGNVDSCDWAQPGEDKIVDTILTQTKTGSIIVCHELHQQTVDCLARILDQLLERKFQFVPVTTFLEGQVENPFADPSYFRERYSQGKIS